MFESKNGVTTYMPPSAVLISLGCAKNLVDSEIMLHQLRKMGYAVGEDPAGATIIVINTCGFLESAVQESVDTILEASIHKKTGCCEKLVVAGCMVQRYGKKLQKLLPEVDIFLGTSYYHKLSKVLIESQKGDTNPIHIRRPDFLATTQMERIRSTPFYSAYLKIADGCSHRCTYCMIPQLRGPYRSRTLEDIRIEAVRLASDGVKEINLIAQDLTAFGSERGETDQLSALLELLEEIDGLEWVRLLYLYPDHIDTRLLATMAQSRKVTPYLDIPFQHCSAGILKAMGRGTNTRHPKATLHLIRTHLPHIALRTSLMVGFPGESPRQFRELLDFLEEARFDHVGAFSFSPEIGTRAAKMPGQLPETVKAERLSELMETQMNISRKRLQKRIGEKLDVLVEGYHEETELLLSGRAAIQAPEVDGNVIITRGTAQVGEIRIAHVTGSHEYDLEVELEESPL